MAVKCRQCYSDLAEQNVKIGVCNSCAEKEIVKLKKRIKLSFICAIGLVVAVLLVSNYVRANAFVSDQIGYVGDVMIPVFGGHFAINSRAFERMFYPTKTAEMVFFIICFFIPFSSYINIDYKTYRRKAETDLFATGLVYRDIAKAGHQKTDDVGMFVMSLLLTVISGPFYFVYRFYRLDKLRKCIKKF